MTLTYSISKTLKNILPKVRLGIVTCKVTVMDSSVELLSKITNIEAEFIHKLSTTVESELEVIAETRQAYRVCGKKPTRYRPSAEALLRRLRLGKGLYKINNVVDSINLLSMSSQFSIGGFDMTKIEGDVMLDIGDANVYNAIGRGPLNIEFMPGVKDSIGFFGTPTSDSERTMVTPDITRLVLVYYDFFGNDSLVDALNSAKETLNLYCKASDVSIEIIE